MLVHLGELALAAVPLDELLLALDLLGLGLDVLRGPRVALDPLAVVGAVVAAEDRQPAVAQLPDPRHRRVEEGPVVRRDEERAARAGGGAPRATRSRRGRGGWSARRGAAGPGRRSRGGRARRGSAGRRTGPSAAAPTRRGRSRGRTAPRRPAGRACSRRGSRSGAGARRRAAPSTRPPCSSSRSSSAIRSRWAAPCRTAARRSGAAMNASSKWASWVSSPSVRPRRRLTVPRSGSSRPATIRRSVVLPAPFGPTRPIRSPSAIAAST